MLVNIFEKGDVSNLDTSLLSLVDKTSSRQAVFELVKWFYFRAEQVRAEQVRAE